MYARRTMLALLLAACGGTEPTPPPVAEAPAAAPPVAAPTPPPAPPATAPPAVAADTPEAAYAAAREAYARGDEAAYFGAYAGTLVCFHGRAEVPRADMEALRREDLMANRGPATEAGPTRLESIEVRRARETSDEVELVDHGWTGRGAYGGDVTFHAKRVLLRRDGTTWRIVAEGPVASTDCGLPAIDGRAPALWTAMRDGWARLVADCEGPPGSSDEEGFPGIGGSNGCMPEVNLTPASVCTAMGTPDEACRRTALDALERLVGEGMYGEPG